MSLESQITDVAQRLHVDAIGFVPLTRGVSSSTEHIYSKWLEQGKHGSMSYLEEHLSLRLNPQKLLEGARSVIVIAISYYPQELQPISAPQIAKYALGKDYHKVIRKLLKNFGDAINEEVAPHEYRAMVDTAPFFERYWAEQSGIGFIGRHHNLIIPRVGSFVFLGELLTTLELNGTTQTHVGCGACRRCIEACPTGALSDGLMDARRCINYLTIEHRGEIPAELSSLFGTRLYGCDTCQNVCPYNRSPHSGCHFIPSSRLLQLDRSDLVNFTEERYAHIFYGSACTRAKYEGMSRNVSIYLKNNPPVK